MELISEIFFYILVSQWYAAHAYTGSTHSHRYLQLTIWK